MKQENVDYKRCSGRTARTLKMASESKAEGHRVLVVVAREASVRWMLRYPEAAGLDRNDFISVKVMEGGSRGRRAKVFIDNEVTDLDLDTSDFYAEIRMIEAQEE